MVVVVSSTVRPVATSTHKLLGKNWHMIGWKKNVKDLKSVEIYGQKFVMLNDKIAPNRCPHRGASLCDGKIVNGRIECPFHKRQFGEESHPDLFGGVIVDDALWYGGRNTTDIPRLPEFDDESYKSIKMSRRLEGINPVSFTLASLDVEHVKQVHSISFVDLKPPSQSLNKYNNTMTYFYETDRVTLQIECRFWIPFTNSLRWVLHDKKRDKTMEPFILFFSATPHDKSSMTLHIRSMRKKVLGEFEFLLDPLFVAISDIPLAEDARVVRGIDSRGWKNDELTSPEDDFIKLYRQRLVEEAPSIIDKFLR